MDCAKCGVEVAEGLKYCGHCGNPLAETPDAKNDQPVQEPGQPASRTSGWIKLSAVCLVLLTGMFGCQQIRASQLAGCRETALRAKSIITVLDVRVGGLQCEYLVRHNYDGAKADWVEPYIFDIYVEKEAK